MSNPFPSPLTPISLPSSAAPSIISSSSSAISRQSSCRSTASVQAVPFRVPIRGSMNGPSSSMGMVRTTSGGGIGRVEAGQTGPGLQIGGNGYFSGAPLMRRGSDTGGAYFGTNGLKPPGMDGALAGWSTNGIGTAMLGEGLSRPEVERAGSSNLSDKPAVREMTMKERDREGSVGTVVLRKTVGDFTFGEILGEGSYSTASTVILVTDKYPPHRQYALKVLDKEHIKREKKTKYVLIERDTLKTLDGHPGIVRLYWTFQDARSLYYVLELAKNGELLTWIKKFGSFSLPSARFYAAQLLSSIEYMHGKGVIHRDLKPENILLDEHMRIKVTDFGTAKLLAAVDVEDVAPTDGEAPAPRARSRSFVGTPEYVSPEILSEKKESSQASDYWGFGCILYQIIAGRPPFQARTEYLMFQKIISLDYEFPAGFPDDAKDLIQRLLVLDPLERLSPPAIQSHPFFNSIDFANIWTCDPPSIETGIMEPREEVVRNFVLDIEDEEGMEDGVGGSEEVGGPRDVGAGGEAVGEAGKGGGGVVDDTPQEEPRTKWTGILHARETILLASQILDRTSLFTKKRMLILTDYPRLICLKDSGSKVSVKSEVFLGVSMKGGNGMMKFEKAEGGEKVFVVKTNQRTFKYEEPSGSAGRWVSELNETHKGQQ